MRTWALHSAIKAQLANLDEAAWILSFTTCAELEEAKLREQWSASSWIKLCDGKRLIDDLHRTYQIPLGKLELKKKIVRQMSVEKTED